MKRRPAVLAFVALLAVILAVPVLAAKPSAAPGQTKEKVETTPVTINGTIETSIDADGEAAYTLTDRGTTYNLQAGPAWFFGDAYPLKPFVGKSVTVVGEQAAGSNKVEVTSIDGSALREPGKPPWAGGWKRVGKIHPGWSQEKADRMKAKFGDCFPPGQCKDKTKAAKPDHTDDADDDEGDEPEASPGA